MYKGSKVGGAKSSTAGATTTPPAPIGLTDEILSNMAVGKVFKDATKRVVGLDRIVWSIGCVYSG